MPQTLFVVSTGIRGVGLTSVSLGLVRALQRANLQVAFCKPIAQPPPGYTGPERSSSLAALITGLKSPDAIDRQHAEDLMSRGEEQLLLEEVVARCQRANNGHAVDVLVVEGLVPGAHTPWATTIDVGMARALDAQVVLVAGPEDRSPAILAEQLATTARRYDDEMGNLLGVVLNRVPVDNKKGFRRTLTGQLSTLDVPELPADVAAPIIGALQAEGLPTLGVVPFAPSLAAPRVQDICEALDAEVLRFRGLERRVRRISVAAMSVPNAIERGMRSGSLILTPGDRADCLMAAALSTLAGARLAGVLLTGGIAPDTRVLNLCEPAFDIGLPLMSVETDTYETARHVDRFTSELSVHDPERAEAVVAAVADALDNDMLTGFASREHETHLSPPAFRHMVIERARAADKRVVLPEGEEPRTVAAASICAGRGIARCVLLGDRKRVLKVADRQGIELGQGIEILDPQEIRSQYIDPLVEARKHRGMHAAHADSELQDNVMLGTMMLRLGEVDGLVSGANHTTANTVRPALQVIRTAPDYNLVSSVFFMCLPQQVLVYGDCAVNPDPNAEQLAEIAIQSAESATAFGIPPRVAMISYSTGASGAGADVEKVARATELVRAQRPDLLVDGPLQYDAASVESVGRKKAPDSPVAGKATVFIFPDLNTGNTTYKAVQRSANVISIGPLLQGLARPVNDLSRGALVDDIVYTIALTAIQAAQVTEQGR